ncbi:MAG: SGNH/GDSL hydrolase family protein [Clostridia bacterium]|nr:SGNH/GDSL hydrolase family protein [Clostridia bacterium]
MNYKPKQNAFERWYPLTYPGYYKKDLSEEKSVCFEHCRLDVTLFRGKEIGLSALWGEGAVSTLTDESGRILLCWEKAPEKLLIPEEGKYLYLNNRYEENPDFYLLVPEGSFQKPNGLLFYEECTKGAYWNGNDFFGNVSEKKRTSKGLLIPTGIENALVIHKSTAFDDWCLTAEVSAPKGDEAICLGTRITQGRPCRHASLCCADLEAKKLFLYRGGNGQEMPEEILQCASLDGVIEKGNFTLRLERINLAIKASLINPVTGKTVSVTQEILQEESETSIAGACKAGKMFDSPQIFALSGSPLLLRIYGAARVFPKVIFFGDSLTQGAHNLPEDGWAQMCAADIGDSLCCGRGSGDIWSCLNQVRSILPPLRPKAMVVTIGGNFRSDTLSLDTIKGLYDKFIRMAEYFGIILILNCIPVCERAHVPEINRILRSLNVPKSRFDVAFTENYEEDGKQLFAYYATDKTHLNPNGNRVLYERFMADFPWLRNL